ncbi:MAG: hypothetical protein ACYS26_09800 [Planctomycetota bacterium]|jgi:hypothetical protein
MKRLIQLLRQHPLLACSLAVNAALGLGFVVDHRHQVAQREGAAEQMWRVDGSYVRLLGDWDAAVRSEDEKRIAELSRLSRSFAEAREAKARTIAGQGFDWAR